MTEPKLKLYGSAIPEALEEYVKQDVSGFANRYYDVGKFLFTVSTFAILAVFTLRTTFGSPYNSVFISILFFFYCLYPSYKLTVGIDYEINPENTILREYELKKAWMKRYLRIWITSFVLGILVLLSSFGYSLLNDNNELTKVEVRLDKINETLGGILTELQKDRQVKEPNTKLCSQYQDIILEIQKLSEQLARHDSKVEFRFNDSEVHEDRHLKLIANKVSHVCNSK